MILQLVLRKAFIDLSNVEVWLREDATRYIFAQHDADDDIKTTHCHVCLDIPTKVESVRRKLVKLGYNRETYSVLEKTAKERLIYDFDKLATYIVKGDLKKTVESFKGVSTDELDGYERQWVSGPSGSHNSVDSKKEKDKTQWDIIKEVLKHAQTHGWCQYKLVPNGESFDEQLCFTDIRQPFDYLVKLLNQHKIRTSRNELERIFVTILRHDPLQTSRIYRSIYQNIFRE
jgi:hypothetical protein